MPGTRYEQKEAIFAVRIRFYSAEGHYIIVDVTALQEYKLLKRPTKYTRRKSVKIPKKSVLRSDASGTVENWQAAADSYHITLSMTAIATIWDLVAENPNVTVSLKQRAGQVQFSLCTGDPKSASNWSNFEVGTFEDFLDKLTED